MKDPIIVPWFLFVVIVIAWRLIQGWTRWFDLFVFGIVFSRPVDAAGLDRWNRARGQHPRARRLSAIHGGLLVAFRGNALIRDVVAGRNRLRWDEWLLLGTLGLQVVLELLVYAELMPVPWFQLLYSVQMFAIGLLAVRVALKLVART